MHGLEKGLERKARRKVKRIGKGKGKIALEPTTKAQGGLEVIALLFL